MLQEFKDVFLDKVPGLRPKKDINFTFELVPGKALVSKTPYRASTPDLLELRVQLQKWWESKYVSPSVSQWRAPVSLEKNKDNTLWWCVGYRQLNRVTANKEKV